MTSRELHKTLSRGARKWIKEVWEAAASFAGRLENLSPVTAPLGVRLVESYTAREEAGEEAQRGLRIYLGHVERRERAAGATGRGGLLVVDGNAAARCGISMKGIDIVVKGSVGHLSAFMAQAGSLVVLGDAGEALGDSIYEAHLYVGGTVKSLGADCVEKPLQDHHRAELARLLKAGGVNGKINVSQFRRYGSARRLYQFHIDNIGSY